MVGLGVIVSPEIVGMTVEVAVALPPAPAPPLAPPAPAPAVAPVSPAPEPCPQPVAGQTANAASAAAPHGARRSHPRLGANR